MVRKKYTNIAIPEELAQTIDKLFKELKLGYRSRAEFATEAIREKIRDLTKLKKL